MTSNIDTVKRLNKASAEKDFKTLESLLHPDYTFKDPTTSFDNPKDFIDFMKSCPMDGSVKTSSFIESGDTVVQIVDCSMTKPAKFNMHMCDILSFKDGKLIAEEVFFDTAQIPEEVAKMASEAAPKAKKAA